MFAYNLLFLACSRYVHVLPEALALSVQKKKKKNMGGALASVPSKQYFKNRYSILVLVKKSV